MGCPADEVAGTSLGTADNVVGEVVGEAEVGRQRGDDVVGGIKAAGASPSDPGIGPPPSPRGATAGFA